MKKHSFIYTLIAIVSLVACNHSSVEEKPKEEVIENPSTQKKEQAADEHKVPPSGEIKKAKFVNATVYAGSTDYSFKIGEEELTVRVSNIPDEKDPGPKLPETLLESNPKEGPPGPNPEMVGKNFDLIYNDKGDLLEIKLSE